MSSDSRVMLARGLHLPSLQVLRPWRRSVRDVGQLIQGFEPETDLERRLADDPALYAGLSWGEPRPGHPEGPVGVHVSDMLRKIEECGETGERPPEPPLLLLLPDGLQKPPPQGAPQSGAH